MPEPRAFVRNAADAQQVRKANESVKFRADRDRGDIQAVMSTPAGRRMMWRFIGECGIYKSIFIPSSEIYYRAGRHDLGLWLVAQIMDTCPQDYLLMQREAANMDAEIEEPSPTEDTL